MHRRNRRVDSRRAFCLPHEWQQRRAGSCFRSGRLADRAAASLRRPSLSRLFAGYLWILRAPTHRGCASILLIEALLLTVFAFVLAREGSPERNTLAYFGFAALPLLAMGLQNATLREVGRSAFPSTYVTGVLDTLAKST